MTLPELGGGTLPRDEKARDLSDLAGTWSEQEAAEFEENVRAFEQLDEALWRPFRLQA